jgi:CheY-like chemotaxis protein
MRVLLVEDEFLLAAALARGLENHGISAEVAPSGESALQRLRDETFDIVMLDRRLPGMSGAEVCRRLRAESDGTRILMLAAANEVEDRVATLSVENDGRATTDAEVSRFREAFVRGSAPTAHNAGLGLGLTLVEAIADAHGGRLDVVARPGGGLRAVATLPATNGLLERARRRSRAPSSRTPLSESPPGARANTPWNRDRDANGFRLQAHRVGGLKGSRTCGRVRRCCHARA